MDTSSVAGGRACCRALNACTCFLPRQRCLGACSCHWKALKVVQQLLSNLFSSETATTAAAGKIPAAGDKCRGDSSDMWGRRDPGSLLLPTWLDCSPDPSPSPCPATPVLLPSLPRAAWGIACMMLSILPPPQIPIPSIPSAISLAARSSPCPTPGCSFRQIHWGWRWCDCSERFQRCCTLHSVGACTGRQ